MTASPVQWTPAKHLILGDDPQLRVYADATVWFKKIELFRQGENERMIDRDPGPEDLEIHKSLLQRLIADGEHLLSLIRQAGLPQNTDGFQPEDVAAALETLRDAYRGWHQPLPKQEREMILKEVFPDPSPGPQ
jgi:hypothetical protein